MKPDLLVVTNPVWESSWMVDRLPVDRFEPADGTAHTDDGGGSALNSACALACAGWRVAAVGRVGDDPEGLACVAALECRGIEARVEIVRGRTTKKNHLYVERSSGATAFETTLPRQSVEPWEGAPPCLEESRLLLLDRLAAGAAGWLAARGGRPGLLNALNRNTPGLRGLEDPRLREALPHLDYLQLPEEAAEGRPVVGPPADPQRIHRPRAFDPLTDREVASLLAAGVGTLVRTRGANGAIIHRRSFPPLRIAAAPTEVVDPTGAGDAFAAGFLDRVLRGAGHDEAAAQGAQWAARACRHLGARAWLDHEPPSA
jgi:sugar/nucleoside kinase (ribokinase family)